MKQILSVLFLFSTVLFFAQSVSGTVISEDGVVLSKVLVVNIRTGEKMMNEDSGAFTITGNSGDELRFVKQGFERAGIVIKNDYYLTVKLIKISEEIEEVEIRKIRLTGDLTNDASRLKVDDSKEKLRQEIGLPRSPEKPREKAADAVDDILRPLIGIPPKLNISAIYDVASGNARRKKRLYKYEDLQENVAWIRSKIDNQYFTDAGIPDDRVMTFIQFALQDTDVLRYANAKNQMGLVSALEAQVLKFRAQATKK